MKHHVFTSEITWRTFTKLSSSYRGLAQGVHSAQSSDARKVVIQVKEWFKQRSGVSVRIVNSNDSRKVVLGWGFCLLVCAVESLSPYLVLSICKSNGTSKVVLGWGSRLFGKRYLKCGVDSLFSYNLQTNIVVHAKWCTQRGVRVGVSSFGGRLLLCAVFFIPLYVRRKWIWTQSSDVSNVRVGVCSFGEWLLMYGVNPLFSFVVQANI